MLKYLKILSKTLRNINHIVIIVVLLGLIYYVSDQIQDLFILTTTHQDRSIKIWLFLGVLLLALQCWICGRLILQFSDFRNFFKERIAPNFEYIRDNSPEEDNAIACVHRWTPRILGVFPILFLLIPYFKLENKENLGDTLQDLLQYFVGILLLYIFIIWFNSKPQQASQFESRSLSFGEVGIRTKLFFMLFGFISLVIFSLIFLPGLGVSMAPRFGTLGIVNFAFAGYVLLFSLLTWVGIRAKLSIVMALFFWVVVISGIKNNTHHTIRILDAPKSPSPTLEEYYKSWSNAEKKDSVIYIVAAEGGGIRAAYWTNLVMSHLDSMNPNFRKRLFAISGVSGGSVGSAFYVAGLAEKIPPSEIKKDISKALMADGLAPIVGSLLASDFVQLLWPGMFDFDRAEFLERAWEKALLDSSKSALLSGAFGELYRNNPSLPLLFFNSTIAQTGQQAVMAATRGKDVFKKEICSLNDSLKAQDMRLSTAALLSARFPFVTPGGRVVFNNNKENERQLDLVDGGYYENSGISTALIIAQKLKNLDTSKHIKIISIKNGFNDTLPKSANNFLLEIKTPPQAFFGAWGRKTDMVVRHGKHVYEKSSQNFIEIDLPRDKKHIIPLGWTLSKSAAQNMNLALKAPSVLNALKLVK